MSIRKRPNGKYMVDIVHPDLPKRYYKTFDRKKDAVAHEARIRGELASGEYQARLERERAAVSFADWWTDSYLPLIQTTNKPKTVKGKAGFWSRHVEPVIGKVHLGEFTAEHVARLKIRIDAGVPTVNRCLALVSHMLSVAVEWGVIRSAPKVAKLKERQKAAEWFQEEELQALLGGSDSTIILLGARTGMRRGEIRALRWDRVDFRRKEITVDLSVVDTSTWGTPKSGKVRYIPMAEDLVWALRNHPRALHSEFVFPGGGTRGEISQGAMDGIAKRHGFNWHKLRHTFASQLVAAGVPLNTVQALGGWSSLQMVMRYAHLAPNGASQRAAIARLGNGTATVLDSEASATT